LEGKLGSQVEQVISATNVMNAKLLQLHLKLAHVGSSVSD
jgi:hypothetical protein